MDYLAKADAAVEPMDQRITCTLRQQPPPAGRVRIDAVYFPYKLIKWDGRNMIATLYINATPDKLAAKNNPELTYLTVIMVIGKYQKKRH